MKDSESGCSEWKREGLNERERMEGWRWKLDHMKSSCARILSQCWHRAKTEIEQSEKPARL